MSFSVSYKVNGRTVSRNQFFDGIEGQIRQAGADQVTGKVRSVRCSQHGKPADISVVRKTRDGFSVSLTGCCDEVVEKAQRAI